MKGNEERLSKWRQLLQLAKPENWSWQPPSEIVAEPIEPPENLRQPLQKAIDELQGAEREVVALRFVAGLNREDIANLFGFKPLLVSVIEQGAIERIAKSLGVDLMTAYSWVMWWGEQRASEIASALSEETQKAISSCIPIGRLYSGFLRWDWTEEEKKHVGSCERCRKLSRKIRERIWHPTAKQLWQYVVDRESLDEQERLDIRYHMDEDKCRRCSLLVSLVLQPLAGALGLTVMPARGIGIEALQEEAPSFGLLMPSQMPLRPTIPKQPKFVAPVSPVAPMGEGFAEEGIQVVGAAEENFRAELRKEDRGYVARAEAKGVVEGVKVHFLWVSLDGNVKFEQKAELQPAYGDWQHAEAVLAQPSESLDEGYFVAVLVPK